MPLFMMLCRYAPRHFYAADAYFSPMLHAKIYGIQCHYAVGAAAAIC